MDKWYTWYTDTPIKWCELFNGRTEAVSPEILKSHDSTQRSASTCPTWHPTLPLLSLFRLAVPLLRHTVQRVRWSQWTSSGGATGTNAASTSAKRRKDQENLPPQAIRMHSTFTLCQIDFNLSWTILTLFPYLIDTVHVCVVWMIAVAL